MLWITFKNNRKIKELKYDNTCIKMVLRSKNIIDELQLCADSRLKKENISTV